MAYNLGQRVFSSIQLVNESLISELDIYYKSLVYFTKVILDPVLAFTALTQREMISEYVFESWNHVCECEPEQNIWLLWIVTHLDVLVCGLQTAACLVKSVKEGTCFQSKQ